MLPPAFDEVLGRREARYVEHERRAHGCAPRKGPLRLARPCHYLRDRPSPREWSRCDPPYSAEEPCRRLPVRGTLSGPSGTSCPGSALCPLPRSDDLGPAARHHHLRGLLLQLALRPARHQAHRTRRRRPPRRSQSRPPAHHPARHASARHHPHTRAPGRLPRPTARPEPPPRPFPRVAVQHGVPADRKHARLLPHGERLRPARRHRHRHSGRGPGLVPDATAAVVLRRRQLRPCRGRLPRNSQGLARDAVRIALAEGVDFTPSTR